MLNPILNILNHILGWWYYHGTIGSWLTQSSLSQLEVGFERQPAARECKDLVHRLGVEEFRAPIWITQARHVHGERPSVSTKHPLHHGFTFALLGRRLKHQRWYSWLSLWRVKGCCCEHMPLVQTSVPRNTISQRTHSQKTAHWTMHRQR